MTANPHGSILDVYAGPAGWDQGLRWLGRDRVLGLEWDPTAAATAEAAGHRRLICDVSRWRPETLCEPLDLLIGSPPCPTFSLAGSGVGRRLIPVLADAIGDALAGRPWTGRARRRCLTITKAYLLTPAAGPRAGWSRDRRHQWAAAQVEQALQVVQPARLIRALRPRAVALEQVVPVLPLWRVYAHHLRQLGYSVAVGKLNAADYGLPQTRERAILAARRDGVPAVLPAATHARVAEEPTLLGPGRERWVSMAEALAPYDERWAQLLGDRPARTACGARQPRWLYEQGSGSYNTGWTVRTSANPTVLATAGAGASAWVVRAGTGAHAAERTADEPAPTVLFGKRLNGGWTLHPQKARGGSHDRDRPCTPDDPAPAVAFGHNAAGWTLTRPATTVQGDARVWPPGHKASTPAEQESGRYGDRAGTDALRIEAWQAGVLQSFPPDYPWQGNRTQQYGQVGDAFPPLLAAHVCAPLLDLPQPGGDR